MGSSQEEDDKGDGDEEEGGEELEEDMGGMAEDAVQVIGMSATMPNVRQVSTDLACLAFI